MSLRRLAVPRVQRFLYSSMRLISYLPIILIYANLINVLIRDFLIINGYLHYPYLFCGIRNHISELIRAPNSYAGTRRPARWICL